MFQLTPENILNSFANFELFKSWVSKINALIFDSLHIKYLNLFRHILISNIPKYRNEVRISKEISLIAYNLPNKILGLRTTRKIKLSIWTLPEAEEDPGPLVQALIWIGISIKAILIKYQFYRLKLCQVLSIYNRTKRKSNWPDKTAANKKDTKKKKVWESSVSNSFISSSLGSMWSVLKRLPRRYHLASSLIKLKIKKSKNWRPRLGDFTILQMCCNP